MYFVDSHGLIWVYDSNNYLYGFENPINQKLDLGQMAGYVGFLWSIYTLTSDRN